jgi:hypothetical protein
MRREHSITKRALITRSWVFWFVMLLYALLGYVCVMQMPLVGAAVGGVVVVMVIALVMPSVTVTRSTLRLRARFRTIEFARSSIRGFSTDEDAEALGVIALDMTNPRHENLVIETKDGAVHSVRFIYGPRRTTRGLVRSLDRWRRSGNPDALRD